MKYQSFEGIVLKIFDSLKSIILRIRGNKLSKPQEQFSYREFSNPYGQKVVLNGGVYIYTGIGAEEPQSDLSGVNRI